MLVCPRRVDGAARFKDLRGGEVADLFRTVQRVGGVVERVSCTLEEMEEEERGRGRGRRMRGGMGSVIDGC